MAERPGSSPSTAGYATNSFNLWQFDSLLEAQVLIGDWRVDYNLNRPHSALNQSTPDQFRKTWTNNHQLKVA